MSSLLKRKRPIGGLRKELTEEEQALYEVIQSKTNMGIVKAELKRELKTMKDNAMNKSIKSLLEKQKIKEVKSVHNKKIYYMGNEFTPSVDLAGDAWYSEGTLDTVFIEHLTKYCLTQIRRQKVATVENLHELVKKCGAFQVEISVGQIREIIRTLMLDNEIIEVKSSGSGDYASIPVGTVCYRSCKKVQTDAGAANATAMVSIPCGACPRINQCTPDGAISPLTSGKTAAASEDDEKKRPVSRSSLAALQVVEDAIE